MVLMGIMCHSVYYIISEPSYTEEQWKLHRYMYDNFEDLHSLYKFQPYDT